MAKRAGSSGRVNGLLLALWLAGAPAFASEVHRFEVASADSAAALRDFGRQSGVQIMVAADVLAGKRLNPVSGEISVDQAFGALLAGTGLQHRYIGERTVALLAPQESGGGETPRAAEPLEEVIVEGKVFNYNSIESASKMPMSVKDTPQSVKVITHDMMEFANVERYTDLYKLDAGGHATHFNDLFIFNYSRGFPSDPEGTSATGIRVDGFRLQSRFMSDFAPYERIEIVKGATSTLYGQASLGGTTNAITKKPLKELGGSFDVEVGSFDHYRGELDVHGPITQDGRVSYRLIGAYLDRDSYIAGAFKEQLTIAPSVKLEITPATSVLLQLNYQTAEFQSSPGVGIQWLGEDFSDGATYVIPDIGANAFLGSADSRAEKDALVALGVLEHRFSNAWMVRGALHYSHAEETLAEFGVGDTDPFGNTLVSLAFEPASEYPAHGAEVNVYGPVELFGREHTLFFGADYAELGSKLGAYGRVYPENPGFGIATHPDYSLFPFPTSIGDFLAGGVYETALDHFIQRSDSLTRYSGVTMQALLKPTDRLSVLLGARRSSSKVYSVSEACVAFEEETCPADFFDTPLGSRERQSDLDTSATTYQAGITFAVTPSANLYASYGEVFQPRSAFAFDPEDPTGQGIHLGPEEGVSYEAGAKGELFDRRFSWSVGLFHVSRENVVQADPLNPNYSVAFGKQRSKGIEIDLQGEVMPGLDVYLSAARMDNEYTQGELAGTAASTGPKLGVSLFASYELQGGWLAGLGFGGGLVYKDRPPFAWDIYGVPLATGAVRDLSSDIAEVDLRLFYGRGDWRFELAATNVLDDKYYSVIGDYSLCCIFRNPEPQLMGKVTRRF